MNKNKGFTLIELLAIIVILAIIAVITVPIILNIIDNAEKGSAQDSALGYKDALQKYYATKSVQNPEQELPSGYMEISELPSDFTVSGENPSDGWVKLKNGLVERYSLKYKDYVVTMDNDKNVVSEKKEQVYTHVTDEYQEVEYLESTGTQYIDTGYFPNSNTKVEIKFMGLDNNPTGALPLFGSRTSAETKSFTVFYTTGSIGRIDYGVYSGSNPTIKFNNNTIHTFIKDKEKNYLDGVYKNSSDSADFSCDYSMYINNVNTSDSSFSKLFSSRLYYTKIYDNDLLVRNLVPVIRKSDNKPGMLDLANYSENLWSYFPNNVTRYGVTFTSDGKKIVLNGTATDSFNVEIKISLSAGIYTLKANANRVPIDESTYCIQVYKPDAVLSGVTNKNAVNGTSTFTLSEDTDNIAIRIRVAKGANYDGFEIIPTLNKGSEALSYETFGYKFYTNAGTGEFVSGPEI